MMERDILGVPKRKKVRISNEASLYKGESGIVVVENKEEDKILVEFDEEDYKHRIWFRSKDVIKIFED